MTLKTVLVEIEDTAIDALKQAGTIIEGVVITIGQQLVAEVKATPIGTMAMNVISLLESHNTSGAEKAVSLVEMITPAIAAYQASGGLSGLKTTVKALASEVGASAYNDFKAAAPQIAATAAKAVNDIAAEAIAA